jgi:hypothetical protein
MAALFIEKFHPLLLEWFPEYLREMDIDPELEDRFDRG